jgi:hypothetical protein
MFSFLTMFALKRNKIVITSVVIIILNSIPNGSSFAFLRNSNPSVVSSQLPPFTGKSLHNVRWIRMLDKKVNSVEEGEPKKLILGEEIKKKLSEIKSKYPTSEAAYLEAAKNRALEYNKKKELGLLNDDDEVSSSEALLKGSDSSVNFGPENLSAFKGFSDEGWEASLKQNDMASLITGGGEQEEEEGEKKETPSLIILDSKSSENDDGDRILLI